MAINSVSVSKTVILLELLCNMLNEYLYKYHKLVNQINKSGTLQICFLSNLWLRLKTVNISSIVSTLPA